LSPKRELQAARAPDQRAGANVAKMLLMSRSPTRVASSM
jgi:hypothetical protein